MGDKHKHLGNKIESTDFGMSGDLMEKRDIYINRNNELLQELHFTHPKTLIKVNNLFNTSFYGSPLWNLFGKEADRLEKTWNVSQRLMLKLHRKTHCYFIEQLSETKHIMLQLYKRRLATSKKTRGLYNAVKDDCRSTTGYNLGRLMLKFRVRNLDEIDTEMLNNATYQDVPSDNEWKMNIAKELIDVINGDSYLPNFDTAEASSILFILFFLLVLNRMCLNKSKLN